MRRDITDVEVGDVLSYRGDEIPFVSKFLFNKARKKGVSYLPHCNRDADKWCDLPGLTTTNYKVVSVEQNRVGKTGKRLPDLYLLSPVDTPSVGDYQKYPFVALRLEDVRVKFLYAEFERSEMDIKENDIEIRPLDVEKEITKNDNWGLF